MRRLGRGLGLLVAVLLGLVVVAPFIYMAGAASYSEVPPEFVRFAANSLVVACFVVAGQVFTSAAAGYAFARLRFPGRDTVFLGFLWLLAIPAIAVLLPRVAMAQALGGVDSYAALASTGLVSLWGVVLLRQTFLTLPRDVEDAARLDGAGEWTVLWRIVLPRCKPALAALAALAFVDWWKNLIWPLAVTRSADMQVVELGLARLYEVQPANWPALMAAGVIASIPSVVVFALAQRSIVSAARAAWSPRGIPAPS